jgi:hypothetical protein
MLLLKVNMDVRHLLAHNIHDLMRDVRMIRWIGFINTTGMG